MILCKFRHQSRNFCVIIYLRIEKIILKQANKKILLTAEVKPEIKAAFKMKVKAEPAKRTKTEEKSKQTALDEIMAMQEREKERHNRLV